VLAITRGNYKPKASDPKIWFTSIKAVAGVFSDENRALLCAITGIRSAQIAALLVWKSVASFQLERGMRRRFRSQSFVMADGERYCLLVDPDSGMPLFYPNL
jgi:hypothetical protein